MRILADYGKELLLFVPKKEKARVYRYERKESGKASRGLDTAWNCGTCGILLAE